MSKLHKLRTLRNHRHFNKASAGVGIVIFAVFGTILLFSSHAATPFASIETEQGNVAGMACTSPDPTASSGSSIKFGGCPTTTGYLTDYYKRWSNGPNPTGNPDIFPISVWLQDPCTQHADRTVNNSVLFKEVGIDIFLGQFVNNELALPDASAQSCAAAAGLTFIAGGAYGRTAETTTVKNSASLGPLIKAYQIFDEPDMFGGPNGGCMDPAILRGWSDSVRAADPTRPVHVNNGKGIVDPYFAGCQSYAKDQYLLATDILSADYYGNCDQYGYQGVWTYGRSVELLRQYGGPTKPIWNFIDTNHACGPAGPNNAQLTPTPAQMKSSIWISIIHGATGIEYFCHDLVAGNPDACLGNDPAITAEIKSTNALIKSLARVINTPSSPTILTTASSAGTNVPIDTMVKQSGGATYIFSIASAGPYPNPTNVYGGTTTGTFSLSNISSGTVTVVGENRTIPLSGGQFTDNFDNNGGSNYKVHIYKVQ